jgi:hypothetical protein
MPSPLLTETRSTDQSPDQPPTPIALSDAQITAVMALARPLSPDQRQFHHFRVTSTQMGLSPPEEQLEL